MFVPSPREEYPRAAPPNIIARDRRSFQGWYFCDRQRVQSVPAAREGFVGDPIHRCFHSVDRAESCRPRWSNQPLGVGGDGHNSPVPVRLWHHR